MTETYTVVFLQELGRLEITCPKKDCGTVINFDAVNPGTVPSRCPSCGVDFGFDENALPEVVRRYRAFHQRMSELGVNARFRIKIPDQPKI